VKFQLIVDFVKADNTIESSDILSNRDRGMALANGPILQNPSPVPASHDPQIRRKYENHRRVLNLLPRRWRLQRRCATVTEAALGSSLFLLLLFFFFFSFSFENGE
jgi:hypothetical protein